MRKSIKTFAWILLVLAAFQASAWAGAVQGTVASVDAAAQTLSISTVEGDSSVAYTAATTWPEGVTDPATLVGKSVEVTTDDATGAATAVAETAVAETEA